MQYGEQIEFENLRKTSCWSDHHVDTSRKMSYKWYDCACVNTHVCLWFQESGCAHCEKTRCILEYVSLEFQSILAYIWKGIQHNSMSCTWRSMLLIYSISSEYQGQMYTWVSPQFLPKRREELNAELTVHGDAQWPWDSWNLSACGNSYFSQWVTCIPWVQFKV